MVRRSYFCALSLLLFWLSLPWWHSLSLRCCKRVHFIWSSVFTILFCLVCDVPTASVVSIVTTEILCIFIWISLQLIMGWSEMILPVENMTYFLRFCSRCRCTKLQNKFASSQKVFPEPVPERELMHRGTAFFALRSCRVRVCSWTQLPPYLYRRLWKISVCHRTSGWHALSLKNLFSAPGQIMGCTLETGISCLVPDTKVSVGNCFGCCWFIIDTSPPGYQMDDDKSEKAADRRRGLLKKVCSQERAVSLRINRPWSDSTSVQKPILRSWMPLSFLSSNSACYWDPEFVLLNTGSHHLICSHQGEYTATPGNNGVSIMSRILP